MIRARDLSVTLAGRRVLDHIEFNVDKGETVALVGSNGAGKTTILRCLLGLVHFEGEIIVAGIDIRADPVEAKRHIGYMPQVPAFCETRAADNLAFLASLRGVKPDVVPGLLKRVGLQGHESRPVRVFSTGMKQRLSLAAALIGNPSILILDEPTASLDLKGQADIMRLLVELRGEGHTILISSHRSEEIRALAAKITVLDEGKVVASGPLREVASRIWPEENKAIPIRRFES
ncbi:MAG: ABC transporter ATP-binding protein [Deltaproteobacteria bacterium]|nr:ABC transporter ATP-binding protein [Deltaproteobacteria bacterium]